MGRGYNDFVKIYWEILVIAELKEVQENQLIFMVGVQYLNGNLKFYSCGFVDLPLD